MACETLLNRLKKVAAEELNLTTTDGIVLKENAVYLNDKKLENLDWTSLVMAAFVKRVSLSEHAHYATPSVNFDWSVGKGHPFAYHVFGTAIVSVTVDCLRGIYEIDSVKVVHDAGQSMNIPIDKGQCEGGIVQGLGWMTMEELVYDKDGRLRSNALSTYKIPDIYSVPKDLDVQFLETKTESLAIFNSKAVGEPPLMYGIGAYFALRNAIKAFNTEGVLAFDAPLTAEKVLMGLYEVSAVAV